MDCRAQPEETRTDSSREHDSAASDPEPAAGGSSAPREPDAALLRQVEGFDSLPDEDRARLLEIASTLTRRGERPGFILSALKSTAQVLRDLRVEEARTAEIYSREDVRRFIEENAAPVLEGPVQPVRREWKRVERERLLEHTIGLVRRARAAKAPHEVRKMRNLLLKVDQRELRRVLGSDAEDLCRQIGALLRGFAARF